MTLMKQIHVLLAWFKTCPSERVEKNPNIYLKEKQRQPVPQDNITDEFIVPRIVNHR